MFIFRGCPIIHSLSNGAMLERLHGECHIMMQQLMQIQYTKRSICFPGYGKPNVAIFNSFNFISSFVFCIQLCVQYSTCIQHSTRYSMFNFPFNIQLFILYSILHSPIQLPIQQFQLFIQHSTIHSTFNYSFQFN